MNVKLLISEKSYGNLLCLQMIFYHICWIFFALNLFFLSYILDDQDEWNLCRLEVNPRNPKILKCWFCCYLQGLVPYTWLWFQYFYLRKIFGNKLLVIPAAETWNWNFPAPKKVCCLKVKVAVNLVNSLSDISRTCYCKCTPSI